MAEDVWFGWRARRAGARTAFAPEAQVHHAVLPRTLRQFIRDQHRVRHFPEIARRMPEIRDQMFFGRYFLSSRSAAFDTAVLSLLLGAVLRSTRPLVGVLPYGYLLGRDATRHGRTAPAFVAVAALREAVRCASLIQGSVACRTPVL